MSEGFLGVALMAGRHSAWHPSGYVEMVNKFDVITPLFANCLVSFVLSLETGTKLSVLC